MDAWIGNIDRHHENWGILLSKDAIHLAPTFDHAASLGAQLEDNERSNRLKSRDPSFQVNAYVQRPRVRSALYLKAEDTHALGLLEAFSIWSQGTPNRAIWIDRLASIDEPTITSLASQILTGVASEPATAFALDMLKCNKKRIMEKR